LIEFERMLAPQMCGRGEGSRVIILHLLRSIQLTELLVWR
jgi:hypothetical protein